MRRVLQQNFVQNRHNHEEVYKLLREHQAMIPSESVKELTDAAYAYREMEKYIDDIRKEVKATRERCEKTAALIHLRDLGVTSDKIETEYCSARINTRQMSSIPTFERKPEEYNKLMDFLGVDHNLRDQGKILTDQGEIETEVVKVNWQGFTDLLTRLAANGFPLPDGIDTKATFIEYSLHIRKRKGVLEDNEPSIF